MHNPVIKHDTPGPPKVPVITPNMGNKMVKNAAMHTAPIALFLMQGWQKLS